MDTSTGHLVANIGLLAEEDKSKYTEVPEELTTEAKAALGENLDTFIDLKNKSNLALWARKTSVKRRKAAKIAKASRKRNRGQ